MEHLSWCLQWTVRQWWRIHSITRVTIPISRFVMFWKRFRHMHCPYSWSLPLSLMLNSSFFFPLNWAPGLNADLMSKRGCQTSNPQENGNITYWTTMMDDWTTLKGRQCWEGNEWTSYIADVDKVRESKEREKGEGKRGMQNEMELFLSLPSRVFEQFSPL